MPKTLLRAAATAGAAVLAGLVVAAGPAAAAGATIVIEDGVAFTGEATPVSGTCASGSESAVVSVSQGGKLLDEQGFDVATDGSYEGLLDLSAGTFGPAEAEVHCFVYGQDAPTSDGTAQFMLVDGTFDLQEIDVTLSASRVAVGGSLTVSGACPEGTSAAFVAVGLEDADEPFYEEAADVAANGTVSAVVPIRGDGVQPGAAVAVVYCGDVDGGVPPNAFGFSEFAIVAAPAATPAPQQPRPASAVPVLANTGSENWPLAATGAGLLVGGAGLLVARRRLI
jgi:LPXTG-motif cell wall-anchored protein